MKKKIIIILSILLAIIVISLGCLVVYYNNSLKPVDKKNQETLVQVTFVINPGQSSKEIISKLYEAGLIKNKYTGYVYLRLHKDYSLQAGTYELDRSMSFEEIIKKIANGEVIDNSTSITFVEGKRLVYYVKLISENFPYSEEEILDVITDREYLQELIDKYWFLTDEILNDKLYYALEGYLYPDTYAFYEDASIKDIINVLLNGTSNKLTSLKDQIENSEYSIHELLTMASIVELEGANSDDRFGVAGVFFNRLNNGWSLGSDVTTYYAARVELSERDLYQKEIDEVNAYNTRVSAMAGKLPVGPICSPSLDSILASLNPKEHDFFYFVADKDGKTYFTKTNEEHTIKVQELKRNGLWFVYE